MTFFPSHCNFQNLVTGRMIDSGNTWWFISVRAGSPLSLQRKKLVEHFKQTIFLHQTAPSVTSTTKASLVRFNAKNFSFFV